MAKSHILTRNLRIMEQLAQGDKSLEELATSVKFRKRYIESSLATFAEQGLAYQKDNGSYSLQDDVRDNIGTVMGIVGPWMNNVLPISYEEVAKDTAEIIFSKSWEEVYVQDILLYGSVSRGKQNPNDIDMVIIHGGKRLAEFDPYEEAAGNAYYDQPVGKGNARHNSHWIFSLLGYKDDEADSALLHISKRIERLEAGTMSEEEIRKAVDDSLPWEIKDFLETGDWYEHRGAKPTEEDIEKHRETAFRTSFQRRYDFNGIDNVFDVHVLHSKLLGDNSSIERAYQKSLKYGKDVAASWRENDYRVAERTRREAIDQSRDPTFLHHILNEGRLYNARTGDFSIPIEEKYPGALALFEVKSE